MCLCLCRNVCVCFHPVFVAHFPRFEIIMGLNIVNCMPSIKCDMSARLRLWQNRKRSGTKSATRNVMNAHRVTIKIASISEIGMLTYGKTCYRNCFGVFFLIDLAIFHKITDLIVEIINTVVIDAKEREKNKINTSISGTYVFVNRKKPAKVQRSHRSAGWKTKIINLLKKMIAYAPNICRERFSDNLGETISKTIPAWN